MAGDETARGRAPSGEGWLGGLTGFEVSDVGFMARGLKVELCIIVDFSGIGAGIMCLLIEPLEYWTQQNSRLP